MTNQDDFTLENLTNQSCSIGLSQRVYCKSVVCKPMPYYNTLWSVNKAASCNVLMEYQGVNGTMVSQVLNWTLAYISICIWYQIENIRRRG